MSAPPLYYDTPWWRAGDAPITYGPSYTDLPLNAVYPFYAINSDATKSPAGWVNGSLRSADLVLAKLGLSPLVDRAKPCPPPHDAGRS